jgi:hypothetical protein
MELEVIPRLAKGSWSSDMGVGCIMNLKCWEQQVDVRRPHITDQPEGFHPVVRRALIALNDRMCTETTPYALPMAGYTISGDVVTANLICAKHTMWLIDTANALQGLTIHLMSTLPFVDQRMIEHRLQYIERITEFGMRFADMQQLERAVENLVQGWARVKRDLGFRSELNEERFRKAIVRLNSTPFSRPELEQYKAYNDTFVVQPVFPHYELSNPYSTYSKSYGDAVTSGAQPKVSIT